MTSKIMRCQMCDEPASELFKEGDAIVAQLCKRCRKSLSCADCGAKPAEIVVTDDGEIIWLCLGCRRRMIAEDIDDLEQLGLIVKTGELRDGLPVYVARELYRPGQPH